MFSWRVIGLGNPLRGDDGIGCRAIKELELLAVPEDIDLVDGGSGGMNIITLFEGAEQLLLIDAVDMNLPAGTLVQLSKEQLLAVATETGASDLHSGNLPHLLQFAEALGMLNQVTFCGVQVASVEFEQALSAAVEDVVPLLLKRVRAILKLKN